MNIQLPDSLEQITIAALMQGEVGYSVPWAMYADTDGSMWVNGKYGFANEPGEPGTTMQMSVRRVRGGLAVDLSRVDDDMKAYSRDGAHFVGGSDPIAVVELTGVE